MAKKATPPPKQAPKKAPAPARSAASKNVGKSFDFEPWLPWIAVGLTLLAYLPALGSGFTNWDDQYYVYENTLLQTPGKLGELLSTPFGGNFHPLTMFSLWLNYSVSGLEPWSYHLLNVLLHLTNTFLVWRLAQRLSRGQALVSFATAVLFGVHPLHVESVAWVAERKDVLYGCFFLLGLLQWMRYVDDKNKFAYALTLVFFTLSVLAKPAAVIFPLAVGAIDFYRKRPLNAVFFLEKIPLLAIAALFGWITLQVQGAVGATGLQEVLGWDRRLLFACYGLMMYIVKTIVPYPLVPFYPLPAMKDALPWAYFAAPFFVGALAFAGYYFGRKQRAIAFGLLFYAVNLLLVIQLIPVGSAIIADRYSYLPLIGLFYAGAWLLTRLPLGKNGALGIVFTLGGLCALLTWAQAGIWKNGETLWDHAIAHVPSPTAFKNRALLYLEAGQKNPKTMEAMRDKALECYNGAIQLNPKEHEAYTQRGLIYYNRNQFGPAVTEATRAIEIKPDFVIALNNRGIALMGQNENAPAVLDFDKALSLDPTYKIAWKNRGMAHFNLKHYPESIADLRKYLEFEPSDGDIMNSIGVAQQLSGDYPGSLETFDRALSLAKNKGSVLVNRAYSHLMLGQREQAVADGRAALQAGAQLPPDFRATLQI